MRSVPFSQVLDGLTFAMGMDPADLQQNQRDNMVDKINRVTRLAWNMDAWWPWTSKESITYRLAWDAAVTYAAGAEVWHEPSYYRALAATTGEVPGSSPLAWELLERVTPDFPLLENWGDVLSVEDSRGFDFPFVLRGDRVYLEEGAPVFPVVTYTWPVPRFSGRPWDALATYATGDLVLAEDGFCYKAKGASTGNDPRLVPASWEVVLFPEILEEHVVQGAFSRMLEEDGQFEKAMVAKALAREFLEMEMDRVLLKQRQGRRFTVGY